MAESKKSKVASVAVDPKVAITSLKIPDVVLDAVSEELRKGVSDGLMSVMALYDDGKITRDERDALLREVGELAVETTAAALDAALDLPPGLEEASDMAIRAIVDVVKPKLADWIDGAYRWFGGLFTRDAQEFLKDIQRREIKGRTKAADNLVRIFVRKHPGEAKAAGYRVHVDGTVLRGAD